MSKTIPFGSYQEGIGLLPATKLAPTWEIWWAQQGSNLWPLACKAECGKDCVQLSGSVHAFELRKPCPEVP
jgi:hypothetical protein